MIIGATRKDPPHSFFVVHKQRMNECFSMSICVSVGDRYYKYWHSL